MLKDIGTKFSSISKILSLPVLILLGIGVGILIGRKRGIPFIMTEGEYSIGIYTGKSPFELKSPAEVTNPVLTAEDVTDVNALFVADPFMVKEKGVWYMFFEVLNQESFHGDIGLAVSNDGFNWKYEQIVLDENHHLSYPYVFKWNDEYYMVPESQKAYAVQLYKASDFPTEWSFVKNLLVGNYNDSSIFVYDDRWWMLTSDRMDMLRLFHAEDLFGLWIEHPESPVVFRDKNVALSAGRVLLEKKRLYRFAQDCEPEYGYMVRAFEITELTTETYREKAVPENPILKPSGRGWNAEKMHHVDLHKIEEKKWIASVDGNARYLRFGIDY